MSAERASEERASAERGRPAFPANRSMPPGVVIPVLAYSDVAAAAAWLCAAFGFAERLRIADHRIQLAVGGGDGDAGSVVVTDGGTTQPAAGASFEYHSIMVRVADADAHCARARRHGADIVAPPTTYSYGERQYSARDLAGHHWTFSQTVADVAPSEWGGELLA